MRTKTCTAYVPDAQAWLSEKARHYDAKSLFLPAGETPRPLYAEWRKTFPAVLRGVELQQVDDVIEGPEAGIFARFFREELPGHHVLPPEKERSADLAILGLGTNGHLAFHEPGIPKEFRFGTVALHADTAARLGIAPGTKASTFGAGAFLATKAVLLIVRGKGKEEALKRLQDGDSTLPAAALLAHPDLTVLIEKS